MHKLLIATAALAPAATSLPAAAQSLPEPIPGTEHSITDFSWLTGHNSFEASTAADSLPCIGAQPPPFDVQLDLYGVSFLELDLAWRVFPDATDPLDQVVPWVQHLCVDVCGNDFFTTKLTEIARSQAIHERFIIVQLDTSGLAGPKVDGLCSTNLSIGDFVMDFDDLEFTGIDPNEQPERRLQLLENAIFSVISPDLIVYPTETGAPGVGSNPELTTWPSAQELRRQGRSLIFITNSSLPQNRRGIPFRRQDIYPALYSGGALSAGDVPDPTTRPDYSPNRFVRAFPGTSACGAADLADTALALGYGLPADNCLGPGSSAPLSNIRFHPPSPMYVDADFIVSGLEQLEYGTPLAPYSGSTALDKALKRIDDFTSVKKRSMIELKVEPGEYAAPGRPGGLTGPIDSAVIIRPQGGPVVIR